jgi:hypothetical protein
VIAVFGLALAGLLLAGSASAARTRQTSVTEVRVTLSDGRLAVSRTGLQAGATTFVVVNKGHKRHALAITGPGLRKVRTPDLPTGRRAKLTVTLRKGAYALVDPSRTSSMRWLVVTPANAVHASGTSSVSPGATTGAVPTFNPTDPMTCD